MKYFIDSHTHITNENLDIALYQEDVKKAKAAGILKVMLVFSDRKEIAILDKVKDDPFFDLAHGFFPCDVDRLNDDDYAELEKLLIEYPFKALGEIGLDYHWSPETKAIQKEAFIRQIKLADKLGLPIIIHAREALQDTYDILKAHNNRRKGVMHCYSGSLEMAKEFIKLGYYISFAGPVTYKNNRKSVECAKAIDIDYLLCETDAPYLTPVPKRGERNETANVRLVYEFIAGLRGMDLDDLKKKVAANYERLFG